MPKPPLRPATYDRYDPHPEVCSQCHKIPKFCECEDTPVKLLVFRGMAFHKGRQVETVVAAPNKARARELLRVTRGEIANFPVTQNEVTVEAAMAKPEVVLINLNGQWVERV